MAFADAARPLAYAGPTDRVQYLKRVMLWTTGGLTVAMTTGLVTAGILFGAASLGMTFLFSPIISMVVIFGSYAIAHFVARKMVFGQSKVLGFGLGTFFEGISMGYLLLEAVLIGISQGNPLGLIASAMLLTGLTGAGMTAYVWTSPREFKLLGAALSGLFLPMMLLMVVSFVFPSLFGGTLGMIMTAGFVLISAGGLLYQVNAVLHRLHTDQHIEGAYMITMGLLVLFWNILVLLMRLNRR